MKLGMSVARVDMSVVCECSCLHKDSRVGINSLQFHGCPLSCCANRVDKVLVVQFMK